MRVQTIDGGISVPVSGLLEAVELQQSWAQNGICSEIINDGDTAMEQDPYLLWGTPIRGDYPSPVAPGVMYIEEAQKLNLGLTLLLDAQSGEDGEE